MQQRRSYAYPALAVGVVALASAATLIRESDAPALVIAAYRLTLAAVPVGAYAVTGGRRGLPQGRDRLWPLLAGGSLALHFGFWIESVQQTSVVTSVVLVTTNPLFVGLASPFFLGERVAKATWAGIAVSTAGAALIAAEDIGEGLGTISGDIYALLGALFGAAYWMIGRRARPRVAWAGYVGSVYPVAAVLLVAAAIAAGDGFTGYDAKTYLMMALLAFVPQLVGHSAINWSLGFLPAALVAVAILGEPVGATALAALVLDERPSIVEACGSLLVLAGVYVALRPATGDRDVP